MSNAYFSADHYARLSNGSPDTPELIIERTRAARAAAAGIADREQKYPTLTAENAQAAIDYQSERIRFHYEALDGDTR